MSVVTVLMGQAPRGTRIARTLTKAGIEAAILLDATLREQFSAPSELTQHPVEGQPGTDIGDHIILRPQRLRVEGVITETPFSVRGQIAGIASTVASQIGQRLGNALTGGSGVGTAVGGVVTTLGAAKTLAGVLAPPSVVNGREVDLEAARLSGIDRDGAEYKLPEDNFRLRDAVNEFMAIRAAMAPVVIVTGLRKYENFVMTGFEVIREVVIGKTLRVALEFQEVQFAVVGANLEFVPAIKQALPKSQEGRKTTDQVDGEKERKGSILYEMFNSR